KEAREKKNNKPALAESLKQMQREQEAIQRAAEQLPVPEKDPKLQALRKQAADQTRQAAQALDKKNTYQAENMMNQARQALDRLSWDMPSLKQREQQARNEVAQLRRHQEEIARQVEQALKQAEQKGGDAA